MSDKKQKLEKGLTPFGVAVFPRLNKPDTKYNSAGLFNTRLRLPAEEAQPIIDKISALSEEFFAATKKELTAAAADPTLKGEKKAKAKKALAELAFSTDKPYRMAVNDDGDETGEVEFNFKMKATYTDKKTGETKSRKVALFDAKGKPTSVEVWGGSVIAVAFEYMPFYTATVGVGVSLRLQAAQIKELRSGGARDASGYGFGQVEGYEAGDDSDLPNAGKAQKDDGEEAGVDEDEPF